MTYAQFTSLCKGLLVGDNAIPIDPEVQLALFSYASDKVANEADALKLFTASKSDGIVRSGPGNSYVRQMEMPSIVSGKVLESFIIDLDDELCYPLARYFVSFITKEKMAYHVAEAENLIRIYNSKVESYMSRLKQEGGYTV